MIQKDYRMIVGALFTLGMVCALLAGVPSPSPTRAMPPSFPTRSTFAPTSAPPPRPSSTPTSTLPPRPTATPTSSVPSRPTYTPTAHLPPRPGRTPAPTAPSPPTNLPVVGGQLSGGAYIELRVVFQASWTQSEAAWRDLWTVVQWQDSRERWHDVAGWRGALDSAASGEGGVLVGRKVWWVDQDDLGKGPFRWQIYQAGSVIATSVSFQLPSPTEPVRWIEVTLPY